MSSARQLIKRCALAPLKFRPVRSRLAFWLNQEHYPELQIQVPLSHGLVCPILSPEYWCSFSEIFVNAEYASAFEMIPLPNRWIDLGCHAGFFSLYVEWMRRKAGIRSAPECILIDADARVENSVREVNAGNELDFKFAHGGIGGGEAMRFTERGFMASSATELDARDGVVSLVPTFHADAIAHAMSGPYDLIKVDIEGSEHELLKSYGTVLRQARHLLLEWHSWHRGGGGKEQLIAMAEALDFEVRAEIRLDHDVSDGKKCGVVLLENRAYSTNSVSL
jgi:FkbM family methyltransferase